MNGYWNTNAEREFIINNIHTLKHLNSYYEGIKKREIWGTIDKRLILTLVKNMLNICNTDRALARYKLSI